MDPASAASKLAPLAKPAIRKLLGLNDAVGLFALLKVDIQHSGQIPPGKHALVWERVRLQGADPDIAACLSAYLTGGDIAAARVRLRQRLTELLCFDDAELDDEALVALIADLIEANAPKAALADRGASHTEHALTRADIADVAQQLSALAEEVRERQDSDSDGRAFADSGLEALIGRVVVRVVGCDARFAVAVAVGELPPTVHEITSPGVVIGRGDDAGLRVVGLAAGDVSRRHLAVQPLGMQWTLSDRSTHGTFEVDADTGSWRPIPPGVPIPVEDQMLLRLGGELKLRLELRVPPAPGQRTPGVRQRSGPLMVRIRPVELELVARAMVQRRHQASHEPPPSLNELADTLRWSRSTIHRHQKKLEALPPVKEIMAGRRGKQLPDALGLAFPYLLAPPEPD